MAMNVAQLICKKRDGEPLSASEIEFFIRGFSDKKIPKYQMSAMAMAILLRGMTIEETTELTRHMLHSGVVLKWDQGAPVVDKHSTGGIGDKTSLILAPLLACCGMRVPMVSGRGLGPTGGTLDKLESIPGFRTDLSNRKLKSVVESIGCVITGASRKIAPADKRLYQLRDVTGTVESVPLITASILSKKLAEGLESLVLDVKFGSGAFMQTIEKARELARSLVTVAGSMGVKTVALLTDMNQPLGRMAGNANEVIESIEVLRGGGPTDVRELTLRLGAELQVACGLADDLATATSVLTKKLDQGEAYARWEQMVEAQGGNLRRLVQPAPSIVINAEEDGFVSAVNTRAIGYLIIELGGGRKTTDDKIQHDCGIETLVRIGDRVQRGQPMFHIQTNQQLDESFRRQLLQTTTIVTETTSAVPLVVERIASDEHAGSKQQ
jgi:pyrimidine-nucleoside phosphorylase